MLAPTPWGWPTLAPALGRDAPASLVMRSWRSCSVALMRALKSVITAMLVANRSISSSIFRKSFFIFRMVSRRTRAQERERRMTRGADRTLSLRGSPNALTHTCPLPKRA